MPQRALQYGQVVNTVPRPTTTFGGTSLVMSESTSTNWLAIGLVVLVAVALVAFAAYRFRSG